MNMSGYMPLRVPAGHMPNSSRVNRIAKVGIYSWSILENRSGAARFYVSSTAIIPQNVRLTLRSAIGVKAM
jgi:hypothetical protein